MRKKSKDRDREGKFIKGHLYCGKPSQKVIKKCQNCGKLFLVSKCRRTTAIACSPSCRGKLTKSSFIRCRICEDPRETYFLNPLCRFCFAGYLHLRRLLGKGKKIPDELILVMSQYKRTKEVINEHRKSIKRN